MFGSAPSGRLSSKNWNRRELKRCTTTEICWNKNEDAPTSPVVSTNRQLPNSLKNFCTHSLIALSQVKEYYPPFHPIISLNLSFILPRFCPLLFLILSLPFFLPFLQLGGRPKTNLVHLKRKKNSFCDILNIAFYEAKLLSKFPLTSYNCPPPPPKFLIRSLRSQSWGMMPLIGNTVRDRCSRAPSVHTRRR